MKHTVEVGMSSEEFLEVHISSEKFLRVLGSALKFLEVPRSPYKSLLQVLGRWIIEHGDRRCHGKPSSGGGARSTPWLKYG